MGQTAFPRLNLKRAVSYPLSARIGFEISDYKSMTEPLSLNEVSGRKRLVRARMELHRAEMALYCQEVMAPLRSVESKLNAIKSIPGARVLLIGGLAFLLCSGRFKWIRKKSAFLLPFIWPKLRGMIVNRAMQWGLNHLRFLKP